MPRTRRANRYCVDCGGRLVYYPRLSNPKAPNEFRILVYACPDCTKDFEKPKMFSIKREFSTDPLETIEIQIVDPERKKLEKRKAAPRRTDEPRADLAQDIQQSMGG